MDISTTEDIQNKMNMNQTIDIQHEMNKNQTIDTTQENRVSSFDMEHSGVQQENNALESNKQNLFNAEVQKQLPEFYDEKMWETHTALKEHIETLKASQFTQKNEDGEKTTQSSEMMAVKLALDNLVSSLDKKVVVEFENIGEGIETQRIEVIQKFRQVIRAADNYLGKRKWCFTPSGRYRKNLVKNIKLQCQEEASKLSERSVTSEMISWFSDSNEKAISFSGTDILRFVRSEVIETKRNALSGGNNSDVFRLEKQDERIFKKQEVLPKDIYELVAKIKKQYDSAGDSNEAKALRAFTYAALDNIVLYIEAFKENHKESDNVSKDNFAKFINKTMRYLASAYSESSLKDFKKYFDKIVVADSEFEIEVFDKSFSTKIAGLMSQHKIKFVENEGLVNSELDETKIDRVLRRNSKATKGMAVAIYNGISAGTNLSLRNIATYRTAKMLNMGEVVTESHNVLLNNQGKKSEVLSMEKAKGVSFYEFRSKLVKKFDTNDIRMTPEVARDINRLQTLDLICGQCDRHEENYFVEYKEVKGVVYITKIQGIDNDMAFGKISIEQMKKGFNRLAWLFDAKNVKSFKKIDRITFESIKAMKENFEAMKYKLVDTKIKADEFEKMKSRVDEMFDYFKEGVQIIEDDQIGQAKDLSEWFGVKEKDTDELDKSQLEDACIAQYFKFAGITKISKLPVEAQKENVERQQLNAEETKLPKFFDQKLSKHHEIMKKDMQNLRSSTFKQKGTWGKTVVDSEDMVHVKQKLEALNNILEEDFISDLQNMDIDKHEINDKYKRVIKCYDEVIASSEEYISKRKFCLTIKGYKRRKMVKNILQQCKEEKVKIKDSLTEIITWYMENQNDLKDKSKVTIKYSDLLRFARGEVLENKKVKMTEGIASDVFTVKSQENRIFKTAEKIDYSFENVTSRLIENYSADKGTTKADRIYRDIVIKLLGHMRDKIAKEEAKIDLTNTKEVSHWEAYKSKLADVMLNTFTKDNFQWLDIVIFSSGEIKKVEEDFVGEKILESGGVFSNDKVFLGFAKRLLDEEIKKSNLDKNQISCDIDDSIEKYKKYAKKIKVPSVYGMKNGTDINMRNIATYRMAKMLNMTNLVPECHNVMVKQGDKNFEALSMQKVEGVDFEKFLSLFKKRASDVVLTPKVAKDINRLQLFDMICAQKDRHVGNILLKYEEKAGKVYVTEITGIDNDFSFGEIGKENLQDYGYFYLAGLKTITGDERYKYVDSQTYESIVNLKNRMQEIRFNMLDVGLDNKEFNFLQERINELSEWLETRKVGNNMIISDDLKSAGIDSIEKMYKDNVANSVAGFFIEAGFTKIAEMPT